MTTQTTLHERLAGLASFLPAFESPSFEVGEWDHLETSGRGVRLPVFVRSEPIQAFVRHAHDEGWIRDDHDVRAWLATPDARRLLGDVAALAQATPEQLALLLTVLVTSDPFSRRSLETSYQSGLLLGILRRADELASTLSR